MIRNMFKGPAVCNDMPQDLSAGGREMGKKMNEDYNVCVRYDEMKLNAMKQYLERKNTSVEAEVKQFLDMLFAKTVPMSVREFINFQVKSASESQNLGTENQ